LIENWLVVLEKEMQNTIREICRRGARDFMNPDINYIEQKITEYQA